jgi:hypothetical protein
MPAQTVAVALPYVNWVVLAVLAFGTIRFAFIGARFSQATSGYLRFLAGTAAALGALAFASDLSLTAPSGLAIHPATTELELVRRAALGVFVVASGVAVVTDLRGRRGLALDLAALMASGAVLLAAAIGWAPTLADALPLLVQLAALGMAGGGALAALVLGHWYLVTPKLAPQPLILQARILLVVIAIQMALFVTWVGLGGGPDQRPWEALFGSPALFGWLRLVVSLVFAFVLVAMALRTAQLRSMESATGLLYINLAAVLAGTIGAAALYVTSGVLV